MAKLANTHFIGVLRENSGWGQASRDYLTSLDTISQHWLSARPILLGSPNYKLDDKLKELCIRKTGECDFLIQHCHPFLMSPSGLVKKNIGLFVTECSHFRNSNWTKHLNLMDEVWVPCKHNQKACIDSGVKVPVKIVHHACDIERYSRSVPQNDVVKELKDEGNFVFYTIGDFNPRKNIETLIRAFHIEFNCNEPVALVIKTSHESCHNGHLKILVSDMINRIINESGLRKRGRPISIIVDRLSDAALLGLHASADAFVQTSFAESWSIPAFDAMAMGKTPIVPNYSGYLEYIDEGVGYPIPTHIEYGHSLGHSEWNPMGADVEVGRVDLQSLRDIMREVYESGDKREEKAKKGIDKALNFSFKNIGHQMFSHILEGL